MLHLIPSKRFRHGLTIIEVLFAIGVVLIGLLGLSALIPLATQDANASIRTDAAVRYGVSVTAGMKARNVGTLSNLFRLDLDPRDDDGLGNSGAEVDAVFKPVVSGGSIVPSDNPSFPPLNAAIRGSGQPNYRTGALASFCIDPLLLGRQQTDAEMNTLPAQHTAYQKDRFPYYNEYYTGLTPPNQNLGGIGSGYPYPRMWRVSYGNASSTAFLPPAMATWLTSSHNELVFAKADDRLDPLGQIIDPLSATVAGNRQVEARYSWLATLTPPLDGGGMYKMSTVVIEQRSIADAPNVGLAAAFTATSARNNLEAERVVWVGDAISLGSTTEVDIYGSQLVSDKVVANQWVMLSSQAYTTAGIPHPTTPAAHRWFRVLQVGPSERGSFTVPPAGDFTGWKRRLVLDGPSWSFALGDATMLNDTFMTIVDGAVAVIESEVHINP